jgi:hypothetical protein
MENISLDTCDYTFWGATYLGNQIETLTIGPHVQTLKTGVFGGDNQLSSITIQGKSSTSDFVSYDDSEGSWSWADGYDDSDIVWTGSN